jgi:hypothetical protein
MEEAQEEEGDFRCCLGVLHGNSHVSTGDYFSIKEVNIGIHLPLSVPYHLYPRSVTFYLSL